MLRDIALGGLLSFNSDVDLVVKSVPGKSLEQSLRKMKYQKNAYGGYRVRLEAWQVDVWEFEDTWAFKEGYIRGHQLEDLTKTTFFDWDAVIYETKTDRILSAKDYLERLQNRLVDINLKNNPNELGAIARAIHLLFTKDAKWSPALTKFAKIKIDEFGKPIVIDYYRKKYGQGLLDEQLLNRTLAIMNSYDPAKAFSIRHMEQNELPFLFN